MLWLELSFNTKALVISQMATNESYTSCAVLEENLWPELEFTIGAPACFCSH